MLSTTQIETLKNEKEITILPYNKDFFKGDEEVQLTVAIKNVSILLVKVFEINTESFFKKNYKAIDSNINLDGLRATEE